MRGKGLTRQGTSLRACNCLHPYQDLKYGKGIRVHNCGGTKEAPKDTCTVCSKSKGK